MEKTGSGPIGEEEIMTPIRGLADVKVKAEGLIDMLSSSNTGKARFDNYLHLDLTFTDEAENTFAEFSISNVIGTLRDSDSGTVEPPLTDLEEKKVKVSELILDILREEVRTGNEYGGEASKRNYALKD